MPRKPRLHIPGGLYHIMLRGNNRGAIFFDNADHRRWEELIAKGLSRYGHRLHAYCWMTNHVHMAIQCRIRPVSHFIRDVASQYAKSTNRKMRRSGHLFERRHRQILVQADNYLKVLVRYIHQNPVCAGIVDDLTAYPWSSHNAYLGHDSPEWLTVDWVLSMFSDKRQTARDHYGIFMQTDIDETTLHRLSNDSESDDRILGDDEFAKDVARKTGKRIATASLEEIIAQICAAHDCDETQIVSKSRNRKNAAVRAEIALAATESGAATLATVARRLRRSESALSRGMNSLRARKMQ